LFTIITLTVYLYSVLCTVIIVLILFYTTVKLKLIVTTDLYETSFCIHVDGWLSSLTANLFFISIYLRKFYQKSVYICDILL